MLSDNANNTWNGLNFRLDSEDSIQRQQREDAEINMQELTVLAQHTSVSDVSILINAYYLHMYCIYLAIFECHHEQNCFVSNWSGHPLYPSLCIQFSMDFS